MMRRGVSLVQSNQTLSENNQNYIREFDVLSDNSTLSVVTSANWNQSDSKISRASKFLKQNQLQFWVPEEIPLTRDVKSWNKLTEDEQTTYMQVLGGLTMLDTLQGDIGMPSIMQSVDNHYDKSVLSFMAAMENSVHARSYSLIFNTLATQKQNDNVFEWLEEDKYIQAKANIIKHYYDHAKDNNEQLMLAMFASIMLESFLFYSGFYYPLKFYGEGRLTGAGEIIKLIVRDESIHGVYVGELFKDRFNALDANKQDDIRDTCYDMLNDLFENEIEYTRSVYDKVGETGEVLEFVKYNANKALQNAGLSNYFDHEPINALVMRAISGVGTHDFFSAKGDEYKIAVVEKLQPEDFDFSHISTQLDDNPFEITQ